MIRDVKLLADFENKLAASNAVNIKQNFALANALLNEARHLGIIPLADPLSGLDEKIEFVRNLNAFRGTS